jgi:hypothetical protein
MIGSLIEGFVFVASALISLAVGIMLFRNVKAHERSVQNLDAEIKRAGIKFRQV